MVQTDRVQDLWSVCDSLTAGYASATTRNENRGVLGHYVHKDSVTVCVLVYSESPKPEVRKKEFATHKKALGNLRLGLHANQVTHVAMESTGCTGSRCGRRWKATSS